MDKEEYVPVESTEYPGFYIIPGYPHHLANKEGEIMQLYSSRGYNKGDIRKTHSGMGFLQIAVSPKINRLCSLRVHTLVCTAFYGPRSKSKPFIIFADNKKFNVHYANLKWVSEAEFYDQVVELGVGTAKKVVVWDTIKDPDKNDIRRFPSISKANKWINYQEYYKYGVGSLYNFMSTEHKKLYLNRYIVRYLLNDSPLEISETVDAYQPVLYAMNAISLKLVQGSGPTDIARVVGISPTTLRKCLKKDIQNSTGWIYSFDKNVNWKQLALHYQNHSSDIVCYNTLTKTLLYDKTVLELTSVTGFNYYHIVYLYRQCIYKENEFIIFKLNDKSEKLKVLKALNGIKV